jgi:hypothetical protein
VPADPQTLGWTEPGHAGRRYRHATTTAYGLGRCSCEHCRHAVASYRAERREYEIHHNQRQPHRSLDGAAPLNPLPEPIDLEQYCTRRQARVGGLINEYRLVARRG